MANLPFLEGLEVQCCPLEYLETGVDGEMSFYDSVRGISPLIPFLECLQTTASPVFSDESSLELPKTLGFSFVQNVYVGSKFPWCLTF